MTDATPLWMGAGLAALVLLWLVLRRRRGPTRPAVLLDGSNVMYWRNDAPDIDTVFDVVYFLKARGFAVGVVFDANAGYLLAGKYQHDGALARQLRLPENKVMVVPKGTPADPVILDAARRTGASVITNDRYRDWADAYPSVTQPGFLIRGGFGKEGLWLDLPNTRQDPQA